MRINWDCITFSVFRSYFSSHANKVQKPCLHFVSGEQTGHSTKWKQIILQRNTMNDGQVLKERKREKIKTTKKFKAVSNRGSNGTFKPTFFKSMLNYFKQFSCFFFILLTYYVVAVVYFIYKGKHQCSVDCLHIISGMA